jgi:hypothetical protein
VLSLKSQPGCHSSATSFSVLRDKFQLFHQVLQHLYLLHLHPTALLSVVAVTQMIVSQITLSR